MYPTAFVLAPSRLPADRLPHYLRPMGFLADGTVLLLAVIGLGFVIAIHELGHFLFAKWAGVRVLVYAIGFGPRVWSKTVGETEYSLCLLPLGGYVAMQEEEPEEGAMAAPSRPRVMAGRS